MQPPLPAARPHPGQQRAELIGSLDYSARQRKFQSEQELLQGHEDVTAALRRTRQLMMQNVEQQHGNLSVLGACACASAAAWHLSAPTHVDTHSALGKFRGCTSSVVAANGLRPCVTPSPLTDAPVARLGPADTTNVKLANTRDELQGQKQVFKQSHGLLGSLKRQATAQWCATRWAALRQGGGAASLTKESLQPGMSYGMGAVALLWR
jgi:hypothetical protein